MSFNVEKTKGKRLFQSRTSIERRIDDTRIVLHPLSILLRIGYLSHFYSRPTRVTVNRKSSERTINADFCIGAVITIIFQGYPFLRMRIEGGRRRRKFFLPSPPPTLLYRRKHTFWSCRRLFKILISIYIYNYYTMYTTWLLITRATGHLYAFTTLAASSDWLILIDTLGTVVDCTTHFLLDATKVDRMLRLVIARQWSRQVCPTELTSARWRIIVFSCGPE